MLRRLIRERTGFDYWRHASRSHHVRNAVFLWVPKTAGKSVYFALREAGCYRLKSPDAVRWTFPQRGLVSFKHMDYGRLVDAGLVSREFDESAYKFCFVRDPYDRAVSLFFFLNKKEYVPREMSFLDFWRLVADTKLEPVGVHKLVGLGLCNPQLRWLEHTDPDFTGRFESLDADFRRVVRELGLEGVELPWVNATRHRHFSSYYCDESKQIVDALFDEDFRRFDYPKEIRPAEPAPELAALDG
ncbi:MAG: sulfotransferase family 2 domain-containing protein [Myxococcota bacterium]|nr:sulfotransferase family 2 domain-containing protein [Myxococcota bacterium]